MAHDVDPLAIDFEFLADHSNHVHCVLLAQLPQVGWLVTAAEAAETFALDSAFARTLRGCIWRSVRAVRRSTRGRWWSPFALAPAGSGTDGRTIPAAGVVAH